MKLPQISGKELVNKLRKFGFVVVRQRGSHIRLERNIKDETIKLTIPNHKIIKKGTLHRIIKDAKLILGEVFS
ncbi:MAG: type II toxin-antitoxin system HicA family toxin [Candidatus Pacearchaeota archaeon]